jgi:2-polyprenyl-6-methoxyphenol hydroxylase-like FAD-dependent oxidoreductase
MADSLQDPSALARSMLRGSGAHSTPGGERVIMSNRPTEVLIVGAGPTGLVLALWLVSLGIEVRIIDKTAGPGTTSRALAVHARTLELYRQLGIAGEVVERGLELDAINLWVRGQHVGRADFGDIGQGLSPYPYILIYPQDEHEALLIDHLRRHGVEVERRTELVGFEERDGRVIARLRRSDGAEAVQEAAYLAGCDGAHSTVRAELGITFPGGTYQRVFYVADVELHGAVDNGELHGALDEADFILVFPLRGDHSARLVGTIRPESEARVDELGWEDVSHAAAERMSITVDRVNWFSTYRVHHRVADHFRHERAFLLGDASHIHSPVGGQGMNTGIGDAANLAWKLAATLTGRADATLLDSYEPERIAFARRLVATTDRAFTLVTRDGPLARGVRMNVAPMVFPALMNRPAMRRFMFRTVSQTLVRYRASDLSEGSAGSVHGGDRLPWIGGRDGSGGDNFRPLASLDWQVHVYGEVPPSLAEAAARVELPVHGFAWNADVKAAGLAQGAAYLVRPDGYVALADPEASAVKLERYLDGHHLRLGGRRDERAA